MVRGKHACKVVYGVLVRGTGDLIRDAGGGLFLAEFVSGVLRYGLS